MLERWACIVVLNAVWVSILWRRRRHDHPWLFALYLTFATTDTALWCISFRADGGLELLTSAQLGRDIWIGVVSVFWNSWHLILLYSILKLYYGSIPTAWKYSAAVIAVLLAFSESLGLTPMQRRALSYYAFEPLTLVVTLVYCGRYIWKQVSEGEEIDFLGAAIMITTCMFIVRLLLMVNKWFMLSREQSHYLFFFYMVVIMFAYWALPRLRIWMQRPF